MTDRAQEIIADLMAAQAEDIYQGVEDDPFTKLVLDLLATVTRVPRPQATRALFIALSILRQPVELSLPLSDDTD